MQNNTIIAGVCGVLAGVFLGAVGSDDGARLAKIDDRLEALEARVGEATEEAAAAAQEARKTLRASEGLDTVGEGVDAVRKDVAGLAERLGEIEVGQTDLAEIQNALAENVSSRLEALEKGAEDLPGKLDTLAERTNADEAIAALGERIDALGERVDESAASLGERLAAVLPREVVPTEEQARRTESAPMPAKRPETSEVPASTDAGSTESDADRLAAAVGETGLVLVPGESGMAGDARLFLSRYDGQDVVLRVAGGEDVAVGPDAGTASLANGCELALAGTAGRRAYLTVDCPPSTETAEDAFVPADEEAVLQALIGEDGLVMGFGEARSVGEAKVFLSRMQGRDLMMRIDGKDVAIGPEAGVAALPNGCELALAGMIGRKAYIARTCGGEGMPASEVSAAAETGSGTALEPVSLGIGESAEVGEARVFLSRVHDGAAVLRVAGGEDVTVGAATGAARIGGCEVSLLDVEGRRVRLEPRC